MEITPSIKRRELALLDEEIAVITPHRDRIRELRRLIEIEERHIEMKARAVRMKSELITFPLPSRAPTP